MISLAWNQRNILTIASQILSGNSVVIPTDTIYGVLARSLDVEAVNKVYKIKKRNPSKPFIILVSSEDDLDLFGIKMNEKQRDITQKYWPGKVSMVFECKSPQFEYLHRGTNTLAFRYPDDKKLLELIKMTGPLIAPSANPEGLEPARNIFEAANYFGEEQMYVDDGDRNSPPSTLISLSTKEMVVLRGELPKI